MRDKNVFNIQVVGYSYLGQSLFKTYYVLHKSPMYIKHTI